MNAALGAGYNATVGLQGHRGPWLFVGVSPRNESTIQGMLPNGNYTVELVNFGENGPPREN